MESGRCPPSFPLFSFIFCCHLPSLTHSPSVAAQHSNQILPEYRCDTLTAHYALQWLQDWLNSALISHISFTHITELWDFSSANGRTVIACLQLVHVCHEVTTPLWWTEVCVFSCARACASVQSSSLGNWLRSVCRCVFLCGQICVRHASQAAICIYHYRHHISYLTFPYLSSPLSLSSFTSSDASPSSFHSLSLN